MNGFNFTEKVRLVLATARDEAAQLHHAYVGTEHILLAMTVEDAGVGGVVLQNLGVNRDELRQLLNSTVNVGPNDTVVGPELPYTSRAKKVIEFAMKEAWDMDHFYVGTEHLLLGLLDEQKGIAAQVLGASGVTLAAARAEILRILGETPADTPRLATVPTPIDAVQTSLKPLIYAIEIEYDGGTTVRRRFASKEDALKYLVSSNR